jgi:hypothetical protein
MAKIRLSDNISEFIYLFRKEALFHQKRKKRKEALLYHVLRTKAGIMGSAHIQLQN